MSISGTAFFVSDLGFPSTLTGTMAPAHHTPWLDALDDSMATYLLDEAPDGGG